MTRTDVFPRVRRFLGAALTHLILGAGAILVAFPFFWMVMTALKSEREARGVPKLFPSGWPWQWHWENFLEAWRSEAWHQYFFNTFLVASLVAGCVVVTSLMAGYAFARVRFPGRRALFVMFLATMMVPFEVVLVPNYVTVNWMKRWMVRGLVDVFGADAQNPGKTIAAFWALVAPWSANVFSIFLLTQFFRQLPSDYYDAAQIDGCGHWQFLWRIGAPMAAPAVITVALYSFLGSWNALLWPLVVNSPGEAPVIQVALSYMVREEQEGFNLLMAASTFTVLPIVFLYLVAQRRFIEGVAGSGLKG